MTPLSVLSLLDTNREQRKHFAHQVVEAIKNGEVSALKVHCQVKAMENLIKQFTDEKEGGYLTKEYKAAVLSEAQQYGKTFDFYNGSFSIKEAGHKYDWSKCGDAELLQNMEVYEALGKAIKERQDFLKKLPAKGIDVVDESTGEVTKVFPPAVESTTIVSVSIE